MLDKNNEVFFGEYCRTCKYKNYSETDSPCAECIAEPVNLYSHKPVKWEGVDTLFNQPPKKKDHDVERAVRQAVYLKASDTAKAIDKQSNLESRVHMRDLISCAVDCICDACKDGFTYTYGQMEDVLHSIITGEFHSNEKVITKDHTLGYTRWLSADLPNATEIGDYAFNGNPLLKTINIPNVTKIGYCALGGTTSLWNNRVSEEDTKIFQNIESIDFGGFMESGITCDAKMYSYYYPLLFSKLTEAGTSSFYRCSKLVSIQMDIITYIADNMFSECSYLRQVTAPEATIIKNSAFRRCKFLDFEWGKNPMPKVTEIEYGAFEECVSLKQVTFESVTKIGSSAFGKCYQLSDIGLPSLIDIGNYAFEFCYDLPQVAFPNVKTIGKYAFLGCVNLTVVAIPQVRSIGDNAFVGCPLQYLDLSGVESVPTLGEDALPFIEYTEPNFQIIVPANLYDQFIADNRWGIYANYIYPGGDNCPTVTLNTVGRGEVTDVLTGRSMYSYYSSMPLIRRLANDALPDSPNTVPPFTYQITPRYGYDVLSFTVDEHSNSEIIDCTGSLKKTVTDVRAYTVEDVKGAAYGFVKDSSGWYVSQNKGVANSAAVCKVVFNFPELMRPKITFINYAEAGYDFGIIGKLGQELSLSNAIDTNVWWSGKSENTTNTTSISTSGFAGANFLYIKYRKDGSADKNNDCFKFKITLEEYQNEYQDDYVYQQTSYFYSFDPYCLNHGERTMNVIFGKKAEETKDPYLLIDQLYTDNPMLSMLVGDVADYVYYFSDNTENYKLPVEVGDGIMITIDGVSVAHNITNEMDTFNVGDYEVTLIYIDDNIDITGVVALGCNKDLSGKSVTIRRAPA